MGDNKERGKLEGYTREELMKGVLTLDKSFEESRYKPKAENKEAKQKTQKKV